MTSHPTCRSTTSGTSPGTRVGVSYPDIAASVLWLAGYTVLFVALTLWAVRREDDRRFS